MASDPYQVLGVGRGASDAEVRAAYREQVKRHHPDHNGGSPEAARRFEAVQDAYAEIQRLRARPGAAGSSTARPSTARPSTARPSTASAAGTPPPRRSPDDHSPPPPVFDSDLERRLAEMERAVQKKAEQARKRAARAARRAASEATGPAKRRPTDEELGYITTDDTLSKILADARLELSERFGQAREHPVVRRVTDLVEGLEELAEKLDRPPGGRPGSGRGRPG